MTKNPASSVTVPSSFLLSRAGTVTAGPGGPLRVATLLAALVLAAAGQAAARVHTVGDDEPAEYRSIQEAIDAALADPFGFAGGRVSEVRVAEGIYLERLRVDLPEAAGGGVLAITGGWRPSFADGDRSANRTTVIGNVEPDAGRVLTVDCQRGSLRLSGVTLTGGSSTGWEFGAGARVDAGGACGSIDFESVTLWNNSMVVSEPYWHLAAAGGLYADLRGTAKLNLLHTRFVENVALGDGEDRSAYGAGLVAIVRDTAQLLVSDADFSGNRARGLVAWAAALMVTVNNHASATIEDSRVVANLAIASESARGQGIAVRLIASAETCPDCAGALRFLRNRLVDNRLAAPPEPDPLAAFQLDAYCVDGALSIGSTLVAGGNTSGAYVYANRAAVVALHNLTIANSGGLGLVIRPPESGALELANSIVTMNAGGDYLPFGDVVETANLIGGDPLFVDPSRRDYHLRVGSPAIDTGSLSVLSSSGRYDLDGRWRVVGAAIDRGAYEFQTAAPGGTPGSGLCAIFDPWPVLRATGACICLSDPSLRETRCAFFDPDLFITLAMPSLLLPGQLFDASWSLQPWRGVEGPYALSAALFVDGEEQPLGPLQGPSTLTDGELTYSSLKTTAPQRAVPLRTHLSYQPKVGAPRELTLEVLLPVASPDEP